MKKRQWTQEGNNEEKVAEVDELSEEFIKSSLLDKIDDIEINVNLNYATRKFFFLGNKNGCKFETNLSLKSLAFFVFIAFISGKFFW